MNTATGSRTAPRASQIFEVMKTNHLLGLRALVVCHDRELVRSLARHLFALGIAPWLITKTEVALAALNASRFDLVVLDCDDVHESWALLRRVRQTESNKAATVLALVNHRTSMQTALKLGATLALQKPFSAHLLSLVLGASQGNILPGGQTPARPQLDPTFLRH